MQTDRILKDITKNGKERPWKERKIDNVKYAEYLSILRFKKANNVKECGNILEFKADDYGHLKLARTWFCKSRLCPLCSWRRSMKNSNQLTQILENAYKKYPSGRFLFLTLTSKNSFGSDELRKNLRAMTAASNRFFKYKKIDKNLIGYARSTEITVNPNDYSYNQHMHIILFLSSNYFKNSENYIKQNEWTSFWKKALKVNYEPIVNVEAVKPKNKNTNSLISSAKETAKYQVKSSDFLTHSDEKNLEIIDDLETALNRTRGISYGKIFKEIRKELQLEDENDLINTDEKEYEEISEEVKTVIAKWNFKKKNYFIQ